MTIGTALLIIALLVLIERHHLWKKAGIGLAVLDRASIDMDIGRFAGFIAERVRWSMEKVAA